MQKEVIKIKLSNELDVVLAYKRAIQLSERTGMQLASSTKFATAVSEIGRNAIEHVGEGTISFFVSETDGVKFLEAIVKDYGRGIPNLEEILNRKTIDASVKGCGIVNSRKLVEQFSITTKLNAGTTVVLKKRITNRTFRISNALLDEWRDYFSKQIPVSPYEEIKKQNGYLLEFMESLRLKNIQTENQLEEIRRLNEALEKSNLERDEKNSQLLAMNKDLDDFAYTVSHDLKAPLRNLDGLLDITQDLMNTNETREASEIIAMCKDQVIRMDKMIMDILSYSKSGKQNVIKKEVNVYNLVQDIITSFQLPSGINFYVNENLPSLKTEEIYLQQIFSNLIGNAIKYHDKKEAVIEVDYKMDNNKIEFSVTDDGPGISPEFQNKIFDIFETDSNKSDSTGVGLSIVKKITEGKGGKVWVESMGRGSRFLFTWPAELVPSIKKCS